jgi:surface antigen
MRHTILITGLAALSLVAQGGFAQNIMFLRKGPVAYLNDADKELLRNTLGEALNDGNEGDSFSWENPDSGNSGRFTVLDTHEDFDTTCRNVRTHTEAAGRTGGGIFRLCLADDGTWRFAPAQRESS